MIYSIDELAEAKEKFLNKFNRLLNSQSHWTFTKIRELEALFLSSKRGEVTLYFKKLLQNCKSLDEKKIIGKSFNDLKKTIKEKIVQLLTLIKTQNLFNEDLTIDLNNYFGFQHLLSKTIEKIQNFFQNLNFQVLKGYEVDDFKHNFNFLNFDSYHSAQNEHDTFFIKNTNKSDEKYLLRTHCTNLTIRGLLNTAPNTPARVISIGKVYRNDKDDPTHSSQFFQVDVFQLDKNINLSHLKWTITRFLEYFFEKKIEPLFRISYFPFTEPSIEVDIPCPYCNNKGCSICKYTKYIEILGAGIFHPNVLKNTNHDPEKINGFAFGVGIERLIMIKYKIPDIRYLYRNDFRFNSQF